MPSKQQCIGSIGVAAMAAAALVVLNILNEWVGDIGALLWISAAYALPFFLGIAWGPSGRGHLGRLGGAMFAAALVVGPTVGYALFEQPDLAELRFPLLWALFPLLAAAQGAISFPVGATVRKRRLPD